MLIGVELELVVVRSWKKLELSVQRCIIVARYELFVETMRIRSGESCSVDSKSHWIAIEVRVDELEVEKLKSQNTSCRKEKLICPMSVDTAEESSCHDKTANQIADPTESLSGATLTFVVRSSAVLTTTVSTILACWRC